MDIESVRSITLPEMVIPYTPIPLRYKYPYYHSTTFSVLTF